jgi:hypothetical protein
VIQDEVARVDRCIAHLEAYLFLHTPKVDGRDLHLAVDLDHLAGDT